MKLSNRKGLERFLYLASLIVALAAACSQDTPKTETASEPSMEVLPSWNDVNSKQAIIDYVSSVTDSNSADFIPASDRIATFDNDGTLWSEQPAYFQLFFALDRIKELAPEHPEWQNEEPFRSVLDNDLESLSEQGLEGLLKVVMASHSGMESAEFKTMVRNWVATAEHPTKKVLYKDLVYQPMLELLDFLKQNDFKVYIVSGGGTDFMRAFIGDVYGIPSEQILGSRIATEFKIVDGKPGIYRLPELEFIDDKEGKPLNIEKVIGKKPIFAAGNSDGDLAMLQWTASNSKKNFELYVHHTDSIREWAYDRESHIGKLDKGLDEASRHGWTVVDMAKDWKVIYP